ncbi:histidine phosphatase superfamily [Aspergillus similis]
MKLSTLTTTLAISAASASTSATAKFINYTTVLGYFIQDDPSTDPSTFDYTSHNFGLLDRPYDADTISLSSKTQNLTQWQRFHAQLHYLNAQAPAHVQYKLLFLGRHGEGWHNAAEDYYGTPAWNCYWSLLRGNGTNTWFDADLTPNGIAQAQVAQDYWLAQYKEQKIHFPDVYYSSPMTRALKTANITFGALPLPQIHAAPFVPTVKEGFREGISMHTCDERRTKTYIQDLFPNWVIEEGFSEEDELWSGLEAESSEAQDLRSRRALDDVFFPNDALHSHSKRKRASRTNGVCNAPTPSPVQGGLGNGNGNGKGNSKTSDLVISITAHSGEISSILRVIKHQAFKLSTGAVIPVLVRAEEIDEPQPTTTAAWTASAYCTAPPVTSTASGCVCASSAAPVTTGYPALSLETPY